MCWLSEQLTVDGAVDGEHQVHFPEHIEKLSAAVNDVQVWFLLVVPDRDSGENGPNYSVGVEDLLAVGALARELGS